MNESYWTFYEIDQVLCNLDSVKITVNDVKPIHEVVKPKKQKIKNNHVRFHQKAKKNFKFRKR